MLKACNIIAEVSRRKQSIRLSSDGLYHYASLIQSATTQRSRVSAPLRILFAVSLMWGVPTLACGSFAPRPTPTPSPQPVITTDDPAAPPVVTPTPTIVILEPSPTVAPSPTSAPPAPIAPQGLTPGGRALVTAPAGLNMRSQPTSSSQLLIRLATGKSVNVVEGPAQAENFTWWRVDDGEGHVGWVAERDAETLWLSPEAGAVTSAPAPATGTGGINPNAKPVDRAPRVGDRVEVTMPSGSQLTLRIAPDRDSAIVTRVNIGQRFSIESGPQASDGYDWYLIRSDDNSVRGWAAAGDGRTRWLSPLE